MTQAERRRQVTIAMSRATHADPTALVAACVVAACASWALDNASPSMLLAAAAEEAREAAQEVSTDSRLAEMLTQMSVGTWEPPVNGISLDPYDTVAAALCVRDTGRVPAQRAGQRGATGRRYRYHRRAGGRADGRQADRRAGTRRLRMASSGRPARTRSAIAETAASLATEPRDPVSVRPSRPMSCGHSSGSAGRSLRRTAVAEHLVDERLRHSRLDAGMLTMAAPSDTGGIPAAVTDCGGSADVRRAK